VLFVASQLFGQTVASPTLDPAAITVGRRTVVTVGSLVTFQGSSRPDIVTLWLVRPHGIPVFPLALLNDRGRDGDTIAGDGIYGGRFFWRQDDPGPLDLKVSALFLRQYRTVWSSAATLQANPIGVPDSPRPFNPTKVINDNISGGQVVCNEILLSFKQPQPMDVVNATISGIGATLVGTLPALSVYQIEIPTCTEVALHAAIDTLNANSLVAFAEPNAIGQFTSSFIFTNEDRLYPQQWALPRINAPNAWALIQSGAAIGVIDTGVNSSQEDLAGEVISQFNQCASLDQSYNCVPSLDAQDDDGHGTGVASIAAARTNNGHLMAGVAFQAPIIAEKISYYSPDMMLRNAFTAGQVALAIVDAVLHSARVINLSFTLPPTNVTYAIQLALDYAAKHSCVVVASAGNDDSREAPYPAAYPSVIAVGASDENNQRSVWSYVCPGTFVTPFQASNYGPWIDVYAPGTDIVELKYKDNSDTGWKNECGGGTSAAAAFVTGTASLMLAANPSLTASQAKAVIRGTASDFGTEDDAGNKMLILNAGAAAQEAIALTKEPPPQYVSFLEGNPGVPGDGTLINASFSQFSWSFHPTAPIRLSQVTDGITIFIFPPPGTPNVQSINGGFDTIAPNKSGGCKSGFSSGFPMTSFPTYTVNAVQGAAISFSRAALESMVASIESSRHCGFTLNDMQISVIRVTTSASGAQPIEQLDAVAVAFTKDTMDGP
jgi:subtilisin family serine protease